MQAVMKERPAIADNGNRTIHGYFHEGDIPPLATAYPLIGDRLIGEIARVINAPRLLEVATVLEVTHRYLEEAFSKIRGLSVRAVANPLSVLFWNTEKERVQRIITRESELMHHACEKLALRTDGVAKINEILDGEFGLKLAFGCSCCAIVVSTEDTPALFDSEYYGMRETFGRDFDSDVLCKTGDLFAVDSVADVSDEIFAASADFHQEEAESYARFARVVEGVLKENVVSGKPVTDSRVMTFLRGASQLAA